MSEIVWRLTIRSDERSGDLLSGALYRVGYEGLEIVEDDGRGGPLSIRAYAVTRHGLEELARVVAEVPGCSVATIEEIQVEDWAEEWKKHFKPLPVGDRLLVVAPWQAASKHGDRVPIAIEPGRAFGTGTHASTRLALAAIEEALPDLPGSGPVVDLGCGSGILAIAAAKLGLAPVVAIDIDTDAVEVARENARRNGVQAFVTFIEGDHRSVPEGTRLLAANLSAPVHRAIAAVVAPRIAPGGRALLSGILRDEVDGVARAWPQGWRYTRRDEEEWALLSLAAPAPPPAGR
ncbi:MAG: 50S ribosomal protein L11 methyltransferase [Myxococcota bacterium]|nr:50S ribosomal protein L11 methyltransferase [Myxococcota bacterium]